MFYGRRKRNTAFRSNNNPSSLQLEMKTMTRAVANMFMAGLLFLAVVLACSIGFETDKANQLVAQGNSLIDEGKTLFKDAEEKKEKMLHTDLSQLAEARSIANEAIR